tara:strand:- start:537 stop:680 length:144 start_codon:yes stop_codon:yes gene_type:complete
MPRVREWATRRFNSQEKILTQSRKARKGVIGINGIRNGGCAVRMAFL